MTDEIGIYGKVFSPFPDGQKPLIDHFDLDNLSTETLAIGGFWSASTSKSMGLAESEDWYEDGLGRVINFLDHEGFLVWRGFVNQITLNAGDFSDVRGPLLEVANRVSATYTPRDFSVYPPVDGSQTSTIITEDTDSQERYGILENVVQAGTCPDETAEAVRDRALNEMRLPKTTSQISVTPGSAQNPTVTIDLLGNIHWATKYIYEDDSNGLSFLSDKLKAVLTADPNGIFSTDYNKIADNNYLVNDLEDKLRYAWDILVEMLSIGNDTDDTRRLIGMYESDQIYYNQIPQVLEYEYSLGMHQQISDYGLGSIVLPWRVRPGKWITMKDFLIGRRIQSANLFGDPRNKFIESVRYNSPYSVDISGGQTDRLSQMLAKITYSGGIY